jgi:hypothetical protein
MVAELISGYLDQLGLSPSSLRCLRLHQANGTMNQPVDRREGARARRDGGGVTQHAAGSPLARSAFAGHTRLMRWLFVCSITSVLGVAGVCVGACSSSSTQSGFDASASSSDDGGGTVTCHQVVKTGSVSVAPADACLVLGTGSPVMVLSGPAPAGLLRSPYCATACASIEAGDTWCAVDTAYVDAFGNTPTVDAGAPDAASYACPDYADAGAVQITCYTSQSYQGQCGL